MRTIDDIKQDRFEVLALKREEKRLKRLDNLRNKFGISGTHTEQLSQIKNKLDELKAERQQVDPNFIETE